VGFADGTNVGEVLGLNVGLIVGFGVVECGAMIGEIVGLIDGASVGLDEGEIVGLIVVGRDAVGDTEIVLRKFFKWASRCRVTRIMCV